MRVFVFLISGSRMRVHYTAGTLQVPFAGCRFLCAMGRLEAWGSASGLRLKRLAGQHCRHAVLSLQNASNDHLADLSMDQRLYRGCLPGEAHYRLMALARLLQSGNTCIREPERGACGIAIAVEAVWRSCRSV